MGWDGLGQDRMVGITDMIGMSNSGCHEGMGSDRICGFAPSCRDFMLFVLEDLHQ